MLWINLLWNHVLLERPRYIHISFRRITLSEKRYVRKPSLSYLHIIRWSTMSRWSRHCLYIYIPRTVEDHAATCIYLRPCVVYKDGSLGSALSLDMTVASPVCVTWVGTQPKCRVKPQRQLLFLYKPRGCSRSKHPGGGDIDRAPNVHEQPRVFLGERPCCRRRLTSQRLDVPCWC